jgi:hypothetical protein
MTTLSELLEKAGLKRLLGDSADVSTAILFASADAQPATEFETIEQRCRLPAVTLRKHKYRELMGDYIPDLADYRAILVDLKIVSSQDAAVLDTQHTTRTMREDILYAGDVEEHDTFDACYAMRYPYKHKTGDLIMIYDYLSRQTSRREMLDEAYMAVLTSVKASKLDLPITEYMMSRPFRSLSAKTNSYELFVARAKAAFPGARRVHQQAGQEDSLTGGEPLLNRRPTLSRAAKTPKAGKIVPKDKTGEPARALFEHFLPAKKQSNTDTSLTAVNLFYGTNPTAFASMYDPEYHPTKLLVDLKWFIETKETEVSLVAIKYYHLKKKEVHAVINRAAAKMYTAKPEEDPAGFMDMFCADGIEGSLTNDDALTRESVYTSAVQLYNAKVAEKRAMWPRFSDAVKACLPFQVVWIDSDCTNGNKIARVRSFVRDQTASGKE